MSNCVYFFKNLCLFEGWVEVIKILLLAGSIYVAIWQSNKWRKEITESHKFRIITKVGHTLGHIREQLDDFNFWIKTIYQDLKRTNSISDILITAQNTRIQFLDKTISEMNRIIYEDYHWIDDLVPTMNDVLKDLRFYRAYSEVLFPEKTDRILSETDQIDIINKQEALTSSIIENIGSLDKKIKNEK